MTEQATSFQLPASSKTVHLVYALVITAVVVFACVLAKSYADHAAADAQRDAVISQAKSTISDLEQKITIAQQAAQAQIAALEKQKQQVIASPAAATKIIREIVPSSAPPPASTASSPSTKSSDLPDAPQPMILSQQDQQDLAQFILGCKQCAVEREQLQSQVSDQQQEIDQQKTELAAAMKAAKGGSVWQRTKRAFKYLGIGGAIGAIAVEAAHR